MAAQPHRINVSLDAQHAHKLAALAERTNMQEGTLARALLSSALDDADPAAESVVALLDSIPGAHDRIERGVADAAAGRTIPLDEL